MEYQTVVFRVWPTTGNVIAVYKDQWNGMYKYHALSAVSHNVVNDFADIEAIEKRTRPAKESEYANLRRALEHEGYILTIAEHL